MRHKIIIIALVIATITTVLCIGANAIEYGDTLPAGSIITMKDNMSMGSVAHLTVNTNYNISFKCNDVTYDKMRWGQNSDLYYVIGTERTEVWQYTPHWISQEYRTIELLEEYTLIDGTGLGTYFVLNAESVIQPDETIKDVLSDSKSVFATALTAATIIITWLAANQICLCGLYLFILVAVGGVCKRFVKGS